MAEGEKPTHFHGAPPGILFGRTILVTATRETGRVSRMRLRAAGMAGKSLPGSYLPRSAPNYGNADFTRLLADGIPLRDAGGDFIGGMIAPGLQLMAQSLALNTAQLPQVQEAGSVATHFADSTEAAIWSGCLACQVGAIEHAVHNFSLFTQSEPAGMPLCLLSGGAAAYLSPSLRVPHRLVDNLVLIGLQVSSVC